MRVMTGLGKLLVAALVAGVLVAGLWLPYSVGLGLASNQAATAIESAPSDPMDLPVPQRTTITDDAGTPIAYLYDQNRIDVPLSQMSLLLQQAVISIEDRRFLSHKGVDWRGMVRALLKNSGNGGATQGASTLTQQYVKNYLYLVKAKTAAEKADAIAQTPIRKLREAKLALSLENGPNAKSKDEILQNYLNLVAFGPTTYGAEAASIAFFGVHAINLTLPQAALLAGMINNPNKFNPLDPDHAQDARNRRDLVLDAMARNNYISAATAARAKAQSVQLKATPTPNNCVKAPNATNYGFFCQYILDYLKRAGFDQDVLATGGYTIQSTLNKAAMTQAKAAVDGQVKPADRQAARVANVMAVVEPGTDSRKVLALVANRPYGLDATKGQTVLRLTTTFAPLGAGSTFKLFTAAAAMEQGLGTGTVIDVPQQYRSPLVPAHPFNNAGSFPNQLTLNDALATSPNTAFVQLEDQIGLDKVTQMAVRLGMKGYLLDAGDVDRAFAGAGTDYADQVVAQKIASFTLGVSPVSPLELANVGATIKSDGQWCPPTPVNSITDAKGKLVPFKQEPCAQAVEPALARTLAVAMEGDISEADGTSHTSAVTTGWGQDVNGTWDGRVAAGKTGTTQDYKSSAFLAFTAQYAGAVVTWDYQPRPQSICKNPVRTCSNADAQGGKGLSGGSIPASTWFTAIKALSGSTSNTEFSPADSRYIQGLQQAQVPQVVGLDITTATQQIEQKGFKVTTVATGDSGAPANQVTAQTPQSNALPGTTVTLTVSTGGSTGSGG